MTVFTPFSYIFTPPLLLVGHIFSSSCTFPPRPLRGERRSERPPLPSHYFYRPRGEILILFPRLRSAYNMGRGAKTNMDIFPASHIFFRIVFLAPKTTGMAKSEKDKNTANPGNLAICNLS